MSSEKGFTLIELLIVIGILAVLATVVIIVINPTELVKQARDSTRLSDLGVLNTGLLTAQTQGISFFGTSSIIYVSISDSTSTCANLGLPSLPSGWSYNCVASSTLTKVNGTGWVPVNFTQMTIGSPLSNLPIDPVNTTSSGEYYTYVAGGSWDLTAFPESDKYKMGGSNDKTSKDNGAYPELYEIGSNLTLLPVSRDSSLVGYWKFDETSGALYDSSGHGNSGTQSGGVTYGATGKVGNALSFDGSDDYVDCGNVAILNFTIGNFTVGAWIKTSDVASTIFSKGSLAGSGYIFWINSGGTIGMSALTVESAWSDYFSSFNVNDDKWHHVVFTRSGTSLAIYVDGVKSNLPTLNGNTISGASGYTAKIGKDLAGGYEFNGLIDDVRIYNRALSGAEISAIYNATR